MKFVLTLAISAAAVMNAADPPSKPRVFLAGHGPENITGEAAVGDSRGAVDLTRSSASYDIESMRNFTRECPDVVMTTRRDKADVILLMQREEPSPITPFTKANRIAVFNLDDELVYATHARRLTSASKDACKAILNFVKTKK